MRKIFGNAWVAGTLTALKGVVALGGKQARSYAVVAAVDFTAAEPAHAEGSIWIHSGADGVGSATAGDTFVANGLVQSIGGEWVQIAPEQGWIASNGVTTWQYDLANTVWNEVGAVEPAYAANLTVTGWTADPEGAGYLITEIPAATHGRGNRPSVCVLEISGSVTDPVTSLASPYYSEVALDDKRIYSNGDVRLRIPDGFAFNGRVVIK